MNDIRQEPIKELIAAYPAAGKIMDAFGIGCVTCTAGTCLTGDIVGIHRLDAGTEKRLMQALEKAVAAGPDAVFEDDNLLVPVVTGSIIPRLSPPLRMLVAEHDNIKRVLAALPGIIESLKILTTENKKAVGDALFFIRNYADRFHHAKEEEILFRLFDPDTDIIKVMLTDHVVGREHVRLIDEAMTTGDAGAAARNLEAYRQLLTDHIRREDEILYPWMDSRLDTRQVGQLWEEFDRAERICDTLVVGQCLGWMNNL